MSVTSVGSAGAGEPIPLGDPEQDDFFSQVMLGACLRVVVSLKFESCPWTHCLWFPASLCLVTKTPSYPSLATAPPVEG